ncbi:hypothetical protein [Streptosporangium sp. V21-05]
MGEETGAGDTSAWPAGVVALMASTAPSTVTDPVAVSSRDLRVVATAAI